jgi:hypothetical protein
MMERKAPSHTAPLESVGGEGMQQPSKVRVKKPRKAPRSRRPRPAAGPGATRSSHYPTEADDLDRGFFDRGSTRAYIDDLAALDAVTIYAGAGVSVDSGAPLHDELMPFVLNRWVGELLHVKQLQQHDGDDEAQTKAHLSEASIRRVIDLFANSNSYSAAYLGSIAREIADAVEPRDGSHKDRELIHDISEALNARRATGGGFLARGVSSLAFALKSADRDVAVITSNYDTTIYHQAEHVRKYFPGLDDYTFKVHTSQMGDIETLPHEVALAHVNGSLHSDDSTPPIVSEVDYFARYDADWKLDLGHHEWRAALLDRALSDTICLFIGSSITDPDVLTKLATTKYGQRRYALVLEPDFAYAANLRRMNKNDESVAEREESIRRDRHLARTLVERRLLHLGVIPVMVDFAHQVPQLLTEVALKALAMTRGEDYHSYSERLNDWWSDAAASLGFRTRGDSDGYVLIDRDTRAQSRWYKLLREIRNDVYHREHASARSDEQIMVEVWLRNPNRTLFLWATSEGLWLNGQTAESCTLADGNAYVAQDTFRKGYPILRPLSPPRGHWRYCVSMPVRLNRRHLPVGVVNVLSNRADSKLRDAQHDADHMTMLEDIVKARIIQKLDPRRREVA